jgi:hypothetical protein
METKAFSTASLASISSGVLLCNFSDVHGAAEHLMGHPIWTHEFASKPLWELMKAKLLEQHPSLPTEPPEGTDETNWQAWRDQLIAKLGAELTITKGEEERAADPITTARAMLGPDKPIIAI